MAMPLLLTLLILNICASVSRAHGELEDWTGSKHTYLIPHDWDAALYKWQMQRAKALDIGDYPSQRNGSAIWTHFRNIHDQNFQFKRDDLKAENRREFTEDEECLECKIGYDNQVIAIMEDDIVVENAAHALYKKHPEMSAIVKWKPQSQTFDILKGIVEKLGESSRIQIVGHGRLENGKMVMSGMNGRELAHALHTLPMSEEERIGRISLVGCNLGSQVVQKDEEFLSNTFLVDLLKTFRSDYHIETTVSARTAPVMVDASGRKCTAETDGIIWHNKNPKGKVVAWLDKENNVVHKQSNVTGDKSFYACRAVDCKSLGGEEFCPANTKDEVGNLALVMYEIKKDKIKPKSYSLVKPNDMSWYLEQNTKRIFTDDPDELVKKALTMAGYSSESFVGIVNNTGHLVTVELKENNVTVYREVNVGANVEYQNVHYYDNETKKIRQKMLKVRVVREYQQMVDDINLLGLKGVLKSKQAGDQYEYYRFGDWVISLNLKNYYVGDYFIGRISDHDLSKDIVDALKARNTEKVTYDYMKSKTMLNGKKFLLDTAKKWIYGKNEKVAKRNPAMGEGCLTLAIFVSESIRNFRTHVINMMAIEMIDTNKGLTTNEFIKYHPMARGGTWPDKSKTGFEGLNEENGELVLPLELSFIRLWLNEKQHEHKNKDGVYVYVCKEEKIITHRRLQRENMKDESETAVAKELGNAVGFWTAVEGAVEEAVEGAMAMKQDHAFEKKQFQNRTR